MAATRFADSLSIATGALESEVSPPAARFEEYRFPEALFARRPDAWSRDADVQRTIANRLWWLASPDAMARELPRLATFADGVVRDGFTDVVLLGMGGSSLAPEALRAAMGVRPGRPLDQAGRRALHVHLPRPDAHQVGRVFDGLLRGLSADT